MKKITTTILILLIFFTGYSQNFTHIGQDSIEYELKGNGKPWIVLVHGMGGNMKSFDPIFDSLSKKTTVLRYSRAGLGKSTYNVNEKTFDGIITELEQLLDTLNAPDSLILGGNSYAGLMIRAFATKNPKKVVGLISLDPTFEDYLSVLEKFEPDAKVLESNWINDNTLKVRIDEFESMMSIWTSPKEWKELFDYSPKIPHFCVSSLLVRDSPLRGTSEIMQARFDVHSRIIQHSDINMHIGLSDAGHGVHWAKPQITIDTFIMMLHLVTDANNVYKK
tara:strand:+ start:406 stop:1239 length:834 start_codon:yes stop_codon:yes gene_type:complete